MSLLDRSAQFIAGITKDAPVVKVTLEDDEVGLAESVPEVRSLRVEVPEGEASAPEGVLVVLELALGLKLLPALAENAKVEDVVLGDIGVVVTLEEVTVDTLVEDPVPVLATDVTDEPGKDLRVSRLYMCACSPCRGSGPRGRYPTG